VAKITLEVPEELSQQQRRNELLKEIAQAENEYSQGNVRRGSVADLMAELDKNKDKN
jgi:hypothetical protein